MRASDNFSRAHNSIFMRSHRFMSSSSSSSSLGCPLMKQRSQATGSAETSNSTHAPAACRYRYPAQRTLLRIDMSTNSRKRLWLRVVDLCRRTTQLRARVSTESSLCLSSCFAQYFMTKQLAFSTHLNLNLNLNTRIAALRTVAPRRPGDSEFNYVSLRLYGTT